MAWVAGITGLGVIGPTGHGYEKFWQAVCHSVPTLKPLERFDASAFTCQVAGEVDDGILSACLDARQLKTAPRVTQLGLVAAEMALSDASLGNLSDNRTAVLVGTALGGWADAERQAAVMIDRGMRRVNPFIVSGAGSHGAGSEIAAAVGARGPQFTFSAGCISSLQAIAHGASLVESGVVDVCLAGGAEAPLSPLIFASLCRTNELSSRNECPTESSRPFDVDHSGMVLSEGSAFVVIERIDSKAPPQKKIYAIVRGGDSSCDAQGLYKVDETGGTGASTIKRLLSRLAIDSSSVSYICAHANGSPVFDRKEISVLQRGLGDSFENIPISSVKGTVGHAFGAAGAFQTVATALAIARGEIPPTANLKNAALGCAANHVRGRPLPKKISDALITSYGYGGLNAFLVLGRP